MVKRGILSPSEDELEDGMSSSDERGTSGTEGTSGDEGHTTDEGGTSYDTSGTTSGDDSENITIKLQGEQGEKAVLEIDEVDEKLATEGDDESHGLIIENGRRISITSRVPATRMGRQLEMEMASMEKEAERRRETLEALFDEEEELSSSITHLEKTMLRGKKPLSTDAKKKQKGLEKKKVGSPLDIEKHKRDIIYGWARPPGAPPGRPVVTDAKSSTSQKLAVSRKSSTQKTASVSSKVSKATRSMPEMSEQAADARHSIMYGWAKPVAISAPAAPAYQRHSKSAKKPKGLACEGDKDTEVENKCKVGVTAVQVKMRKLSTAEECAFKSCAPVKPLRGFREKPDSCRPPKK